MDFFHSWLTILKLQVGQNLAPLALDLAIDSSAHKKIKNENFDNFCKEIT
jgi:hypothetical protein